MNRFLSIDTATSLCSVSIFNDSALLSNKEIEKENSHSSLITGFINIVLKESNMRVNDLDYIALSGGPGSYTGLRIGASAAKALAYSLNIPLIVYDTLENMIQGLMYKNNADLYIAAIDARREEIYLSIIDKFKKNVYQSKNVILSNNLFANTLNNKKVVICGNGSEKFLKYHRKFDINSDNTINSSTKFCSNLVLNKVKNKEFEDLIKFEPNYIKHFYVDPRNN